MPRPETAKPFPSREEKYVYEPKEKKLTVIKGGKEVPSPRAEKEEVIPPGGKIEYDPKANVFRIIREVKPPEKAPEREETLIIESEDERKQLYEKARQEWLAGKIDTKTYGQKIRELQGAEIRTFIDPETYEKLQDEIRATFKDPEECAKKLDELDKSIVLVGTEAPKEAAGKAFERKLDLESIAKKIEEGRKKETLTLATALEETGRLLREGKISTLDAADIVNSALASHLESQLKTGKRNLLQGEMVAGYYIGEAEKIRKVVERRRNELIKQATEIMNRRIDLAKAEGRLDFGSHDLHEAFRIQNDAAAEIKSRFGIDMQKPGLWGRIKILKERVINPAEFKVHYEPYKKYKKEYDRMSAQIAEKAPEVLSGKIFDELQEAGLMREVKVPTEAPPAPPEIQAIRNAVEAGQVTPEEGIRMMEITKEELDKASATVKEIQGNIRVIDELREQGLITFSGDEYWKSFARMKALERDLVRQGNYDPNRGFLTNVVRARASGLDLKKYRDMVEKYNEAKKAFDQLETEFMEALPDIDKAKFWKKYWAERKAA